MYIGLGIRKKLKDLQQRFQAPGITGAAKAFKPNPQVSGTDLPYWPVVTAANPTELQLFRWGLLSPDTRSEQVQSTPQRRLHLPTEQVLKRTFSNQPLEQGQRCLVLADCFYIHRHEGKNRVLYQISLRYNQLFALAGIFQIWEQDTQTIPTFTLLTTPANSLLAFLNNKYQRMPVIIDPEAEPLWNSTLPFSDPAIQSLLHPFDPAQLKAERLTHTEQLSLFD